MPGTERDVVNEARQPGPSRGSQFDHSGAGFLNVNEGPGVQKNLAITGGSHNQQFNAESIHIQHQAPAVRGETPPLPDAFLPFRRDPDYVANEAVNEQLRGRLSAAGARVALVGIGGVGKSLCALEYAHRLRKASPDTWVCWLHASNAARFQQSIQEVVVHLRIPGRDNPNADILQLFEGWLRDRRNGEWLLIIDNADDARFLHRPPSAKPRESTAGYQRNYVQYLPHCQHGSILFTSRDRNAARTLVDQADIISLQPMGEHQAIELLQRKLHGAHDDLLSLAQALDFMPLAMTQAAAYIAKQAPRFSIRQYLEALQRDEKSATSLLNLDQGNLRRDPAANNSVIATWQISFEHLRATRRSAADLLSLMSVCDRQAIPEALLTATSHPAQTDHAVKSMAPDDGKSKSAISARDAGARSFRSKLSRAFRREKVDERPRVSSPRPSPPEGQGTSTRAGTKCTFDEDIRVLQDYCFIGSTTEPSTFEMHRLVQLATRHWLTANGKINRWENQLMANLDAILPDGEYENWAVWQTLLPHVQLAIDMRPIERSALLQWASVLSVAAWYLYRKGESKNAEDLAFKSAHVRRQHLGRDSALKLESFAILASVYSQQGRCAEAEKLQIEVLQAGERVLGEEHIDMLRSKANLAVTYCKQGRWAEAEHLEVEVLHARERVLGEEHRDTLTSKANLAYTCSQQGRWAESEELKVEVLQARKRVLGEEHPDTLRSMANLASTYSQQGRWEEAEELEVETLQARERVLGEEHPDTLVSISNLAWTLRGLGRKASAVQLMERCVNSSPRILGGSHPHTLDRQRWLARWKNEAGSHRDEARDTRVEADDGSR